MEKLFKLSELAQSCGVFAGLIIGQAASCHSISMVMAVRESEERTQCKAVVAKKLTSPLSLVEVSAGAVSGVRRARRDQLVDEHFGMS